MRRYLLDTTPLSAYLSAEISVLTADRVTASASKQSP